jgi:hypothetical protein
MSSGSRGDILGRAVGMLVFLIGVALLVFVFIQAFHLFALSPAEALRLRFTGDPKKDPLLAQIGSNFGWILLQVAFLFIMALAASLISQRGINLYFSAMQGAPVPPRPASPPAAVAHVESRGETP